VTTAQRAQGPDLGDPFLEEIVHGVGAPGVHGAIGITLNTSGTVVRGYLTSARRWAEVLQELGHDSGAESAALADVLHTMYSAVFDAEDAEYLRRKAAGEARPFFTYAHLVDVTVVHAGYSESHRAWRVSLASVSGWSLQAPDISTPAS
jgi:hypothetical protein